MLYAESSAVLSWLLGEIDGQLAGEALRSASFVIASQLTLTECEHLGRLTAKRAAEVRAAFRQAARSWFILHLTDEIFDRAQQPFPEEPIRTLDALHLATALDAIRLVPGTKILTLDRRVRRCGRALGLEVLPTDTGSTEASPQSAPQ